MVPVDARLTIQAVLNRPFAEKMQNFIGTIIFSKRTIELAFGIKTHTN